MTIDELIQHLEDLKQESEDGGATEVRIMDQPNWPFEHHITGVVARAELSGGDEGDESTPECGWCRLTGNPAAAECEDCGGAEPPPPPTEKDFDGDEAPKSRVFIVSGGQARYGHRDAWDAARR